MNRKVVFVDTCAWFALADRTDQFHEKAVSHLKKLAYDGFELVTTNLIVYETTMLLSRKLSKRAAILFLSEIYSDDRVQIVWLDPGIEREAYATFRQYAEHDLSIVDCVSFAVMRRDGVRRAFTSDRHFKIMKFAVEP